MAIYLVQHGISLAKDVDPERGLSVEGAQIVERIARTVKDHKLPVKKIVHSGKKRAEQTADIFSQYLQTVEVVQQGPGLSPMDDVIAFAQKLQPESETMYVGHLPFMEKLTGYLTTGNENKPVFTFQNGGIVCLDKSPKDSNWQIKWSLMPNIG
ncbi:MAG: phosphohistidine phosphatase SixA [Gammaproteobacteria bacterium]|nr:phosphohistidine phosphatase SixA [Gammaproteobacteria bacterium]